MHCVLFLCSCQSRPDRWFKKLKKEFCFFSPLHGYTSSPWKQFISNCLLTSPQPTRMLIIWVWRKSSICKNKRKKIHKPLGVEHSFSHSFIHFGNILFPGWEATEANDSACKGITLSYCVISKNMKRGPLLAFEAYSSVDYSHELLASFLVIMHSTAKA